MTGALLVGVLLAAVPVQLEEVRSRSRDNLQSLQAALEAERTGQLQNAARGALLPQLGVSAQALYNWDSAQQRFTNLPDPSAPSGYSLRAVTTPEAHYPTFVLAATLRQLLFDQAQWAQLSQAGASAEAARGEAQEQQATSELEGIRRFYTLYRAQQSLAVLEGNVRRSEDQVARSEALFNAGRSAQSEVLQARVNLGNDRISVITQRAQVAAAQADLAAWLAQPGMTEYEAQDPGLSEVPAPVPSFEQALAKAKETRPLLVALQARVRAAEASQAQARAGYLPQVYAQADYQRFASGTRAEEVFTDPSKQHSVSGGVVLQWNLFRGFADVAQSAAAGAAIEQARARFTQNERELEAEVKKAHLQFQLQVQAAAVAQENRETAANNLTLVTERYKAGASSTLEVRDAQYKLTQAELTLVQYRVDVEVARAALERAMGTLGGGNRS